MAKTETPALDAKLAELLWEPPEVEKAVEGQAGPRKFKYANLLAVMTALRPELKRLHLSWRTMPLVTEDGRFVVRWRITDLDSGECDTGDYPISAESAQGRGSEITYATRYSVTNVTGITPEGDDDDGAAAEKSKRRASARQAPHPDVPELADNLQRGAVTGLQRERPTAPRDDAWSSDLATDQDRKGLFAGLNELGVNTRERTTVLALLSGWIGRELESTKDLTRGEMQTALNSIRAAKLAARDPEGGGSG